MDGKVDYIIIGQGIAGTLVHHFLSAAGRSSIVINETSPHAASQVAAGIINPVTGREFVKSWMFDKLLPKAISTYAELEKILDTKILYAKPIYRGLATIKDENTWLGKCNDFGYDQYMNSRLSDNNNEYYIQDLKFGVTQNSYHVDLPKLCTGYQYSIQDQYIEARFNHALLKVNNVGVQYETFKANGIIFCTGWQALKNSLFEKLPFAPAKGEVLLCRIPNFNEEVIMKHTLFFVPQGEDIYWVGSNYTHEMTVEKPTVKGREALISKIDRILKVPYEVLDHKAGIRPTTRYRRPMIGYHSSYKNVFLFNGLGTKGASLGPYWASRFVKDMIDGNLTDIETFTHEVKRM